MYERTVLALRYGATASSVFLAVCWARESMPTWRGTTQSLTYDARGNRTGSVTTRTTGKKTHDLARVDYTFDGMDQLVGVLDHGDNLNNAKDDSVTEWSRDGLGRGLSVSVNGVVSDRVFDGTALIVDGDTRVTLGPDGRVLSEAFETVEGHGKNATEVTVLRDVLADVLGSAVGVAEDGIVNADLTWFGDFGDTLSAPAWDTVTSFTGHVETAGLVEFATRSYDPASRVWVQEDSFTGTITRGSSLNRYAYVEGSPASHTDVLGAYRAASAMAAQKLSAVDYAQFIVRLKIFSAIGVYNERVERNRKLAAIGAQWASEQDQFRKDQQGLYMYNGLRFAGGAVVGVGQFGWDLVKAPVEMGPVGFLAEFSASPSQYWNIKMDEGRQQREATGQFFGNWARATGSAFDVLTGDKSWSEHWDHEASPFIRDYTYGSFKDNLDNGNYYGAGKQFGETGAATASVVVPGAMALRASRLARVLEVVPSTSAAANTGTALVKYDADFAVGQLTAGGRATASQLDEFGSLQGWARSQTATGPVKFTDGNGVVRLTIKQGSPRAPGSGVPHVELRNPDGIRIDPFGNPVSRTSIGNHTPIVWDW